MTLKEKLTACIQRAVDAQELPGATVLVLRHGKEVAYAEGGLMDRENNRPMARDTICRLYSQTKPITAAAIMLLMERGVIDLFDPVEKFLPGFAHPRVAEGGKLIPAIRSVTIMDLLGMTAGTCYPDDMDVAGLAAKKLFEENDERIRQGKGMTTVELCNRIGELPLAFQPGSHFRYGTCADVLGGIVEVASGRSFSQFLREEFFEPLGMADTGFYVPAEKRDRFAKVYQNPGALVPYEQLNLCVGAYSAEPAYAAGGAGLVSTLDDYAAFATMLLRHGKCAAGQLLAPETVDFFTSAQLGPQPYADMWSSLDGFSYGKMMRVMLEPGRYPGLARKGEYGWDGWLGAYFANFPAEDMTILMMTQRVDYGTSALTRKLRNLILSSEETRG